MLRSLLAICVLLGVAAAEDDPENPKGKVPFECARDESTGLAFFVSEPGAVSFKATWKGPSLRFRVFVPGRKAPVEVEGRGSAEFKEEASADVVKAGDLWRVEISELKPTGKGGKPISGTLELNRPSGDRKAIEAWNKKLDAEIEPRGLVIKKELDDKELEFRKAVDLQARQAEARVIDARKLQVERLRNERGRPVLKDDTAGPPPGSFGITDLSKDHASPLDPVLINGYGFAGNAKVYFKVSRDQDVAATTEVWSDHQLFAYMPDLSGLGEFEGAIYVKQGDVASDRKSFRFVPLMEDRVFQSYDSRVAGRYFGISGNQRYPQDEKTLRSDWTFERAEFLFTEWGGGGRGRSGARLIDSSTGTRQMSATVHFWANAPRGKVTYLVLYHLRGPRGTEPFDE